MFDLRPYQAKAVHAVRVALRAHPRVLLVSPTGSGKTVMFSHIAASASAKGNRIVILGHRQEIVDQISAALDEMAVRHGLVAPGHTMTADLVQVASVQTLVRRIADVPAPALLVPDEAHHATAGSWRKVIDAWPAARVLGVSATPERLDGAGLGAVFGALVQGPTTRELIAEGWLCGYDYFAPPVRVDLSAIRSAMGDYAIAELAGAMDKATITGDAVEHYARLLNGRPAIAFCVTIAHAEHVAERFRAAGFRAAAIDGKMAKGERRERIHDLAAGRLNVLTSCEVISEGVDVPVVAGAILLRPTKSLAMYLQQVGRCLRRKPDGGRAVILDHVGNCTRHGMPDEPRAWSLDGKKARAGAPPVRTCRTCYATFPAAAAPVCKIDDPACPLAADAEAAGAGGKEMPETVSGVLERLDDTLAWAGGADLLLARGAEFAALIERADTIEKLRQIQRARDYHAGWIKHILRARHGRAAA